MISRRIVSLVVVLVLAALLAACGGGSDPSGATSTTRDAADLRDWVSVVEGREMTVVEQAAASVGDSSALSAFQAEKRAGKRVLVRTTAVLYDSEAHAIERTKHTAQRRYPETLLRRGRAVIDVIETWDPEAARTLRDQLVDHGYHG